MVLDDQMLLRYSRQIMLPSFDIAGQEALAAATVLIVGLGGLGSAAALYMAASGTGNLVLADSDVVELSNLQRQIIHREDALGQSKTTSAAHTIAALNAGCHVTCVTERLEGARIDDYVRQADLVLDCTDNYPSRCALNASCLAQKRPLVSAAALRMEGQISVFDARIADSPCYQCLHEMPPENEPGCAEAGVMAPVVGLLGALQAMEAIKILARFGEPLIGRLLTLDATSMEWHSFRLSKRPQCLACGKDANKMPG